jgi:3-polyprenyl-4-hydroxybenzoate decarboxylase
MERDWRQSAKLSNDGLCRRIGDILFASKAGSGTPKYLVMRDDIDITNIREVVWAFATRNPPGERGETIYKQSTNQPLVPYFTPGEKLAGEGTKVIYSCLPPDEWGETMPMSRASFKHNYPAHIQDAVLRRCKEYGFEDAGPVEGALAKP